MSMSVTINSPKVMVEIVKQEDIKSTKDQASTKLGTLIQNTLIQQSSDKPKNEEGKKDLKDASITDLTSQLKDIRKAENKRRRERKGGASLGSCITALLIGAAVLGLGIWGMVVMQNRYHGEEAACRNTFANYNANWTDEEGPCDYYSDYNGRQHVLTPCCESEFAPTSCVGNCTSNDSDKK